MRTKTFLSIKKKFLQSPFMKSNGISKIGVEMKWIRMKSRGEEPKHVLKQLWFSLLSGALWWNGARIIPSSSLTELIHQAFYLEKVSLDVTG
jgi:hypothetical protein